MYVQRCKIPQCRKFPIMLALSSHQLMIQVIIEFRIYWAGAWQNQQNDMGVQQRQISLASTKASSCRQQRLTAWAWAYGQADLNLRWVHMPFSWFCCAVAHTDFNILQVNDIAFHPVHGTLSTVGSDGKFSFWDKDARTKLKTSEQFDQPLTACDFNPHGNIFAYATSYDWSKVSLFKAR